MPAGVTVTIADDNTVIVKGPKGELSQKVNKDITVTQEGNVIHVARPTDDKAHRALHGLYRSLIHNMVTGVTTGFSKSLELVGVGYRAQAESPAKLVINIGFSHPVNVEAPANIKFETPSATQIIVQWHRQAAGWRDRRGYPRHPQAGTLSWQGHSLYGRVRPS